MTSQTALRSYELPAPEELYKPENSGKIFSPDYSLIMQVAALYRQQHNVSPRRKDKYPVGVIGIDYQKTFVARNGELTLAPRPWGPGSNTAYTDAELLSGVVPNSICDVNLFSAFLYRNARVISDLILTLDTHYAFQIFHSAFWLNSRTGEHPAPFTVITKDTIGKEWVVNPEMAYLLLGDMKFLPWLQKYVVHYVTELERLGKPPLVVWPQHARLGHENHALMPVLQVASDFLAFLRWTKIQIRLKGDLGIVEYYGAFGTEILTAHDGTHVGEESDRAVEDLLKYHILVLAGEARSHCDKTTFEQIQAKVAKQDPKLAERIYILEDCMVDVPGFEKQGQDAIDHCRAAGIHIVKSTTPMEDWPGVNPDIFKL